MKNERKIRSRILQYIYNCGETSKQSISKDLGLSMPTTLEHIKLLNKAGLIQESGLFASTGGRKAGILKGVACTRIAVGIDITKNHIGLVLVDLAGRAILHERISRKFDISDEYNDQLRENIVSLLERKKIKAEIILGVGISLPGILDITGTRIEYSHALGLRNYTCNRISTAIGYPCKYENDANAAGMAEYRRLSKPHPMAYLSLSNSVGGAFFPNDSLYSGVNRRSGEFGHMCLVPKGRRCYCGKDGCTDAYCSASTLSDPYAGKLQIFFSELEMDNPQAHRLWDIYTDSLVLCTNNLRMAFDCEVILGGYVGGYIEKHLAGIREKASWLNTFEPSGDYILPCVYKNEAAAIGAALWWIDRFIDSTNEGLDNL